MDRQDGFFPHHRMSCAKSFLPDCVIEILRHVKKKGKYETRDNTDDDGDSRA